MHQVYQDILDSIHVSALTRENLMKFFRSLPDDPNTLTPEKVKERLKGLAESTQRTYISYFAHIERALDRRFVEVRLPKWRPRMQKKQLYTQKELARIYEACVETRDRALFQVLYESALRAREILSIDFKDIKPTKALWWMTLLGKGSRVRTVPILHSVPALQQWLDVHPVGEGPVWITLVRPFRRLSYQALRARIRLVLSRAEVPRRRNPLHLFRHTRLTELTSMGMTEAELCVFAGWHIGSPMSKIYVHLSGRDLGRSMARLYGLDVEQEEPALKLEQIQCPRCKKTNPSGARFCAQCSFVLDERLAMRMQPGDQLSDIEAMQKESKELDERVKKLEKELDERG